MRQLPETRRSAGPALFIASVLCAFLPGCDRSPGGEASAVSPPPRPNIIFIMVDTLRTDRVGCYGHTGRLSGMIDALAQEGVLFERAIAPSSWTLPSVASLFCGLFPTTHKVTSYQEAIDSTKAGGKVRYFSEEFATLAEVLHDNGYQTAGFSANPFITEKYGFAQGFEHFDARFAANTTPGNVVNATALRWLAVRDQSRPFFLYLHYMDVHGPYWARDEHLDPQLDAVEAMPNKRPLTRAEAERFSRFFSKAATAYQDSPRHRQLFPYAEYWQARYDAGAAQVNQYLEELRAKLRELGLWDTAYVILTADHGEALGEHSIWAHGWSLHQDQLDVPLILRWPGKLPAGQRFRQTVRLFDIMPTLLAQLRISPPATSQARSLDGLIQGGMHDPLPAFAEAIKKGPAQHAFVLAEWKLLAYTDEGRYELYNLNDDPTEQHDLAHQQPRRVAELKRLLTEQMAENRALGQGIQIQHVDVTEEELRRFKAVGYFGGDEDEEGDDAEEGPNPNRGKKPQP